MATKRTYINADEELVIKGQLTIEGNVTQVETTETVTNLQGNVFTINSDGDNTAAILRLNSNGSLATLSYTDSGNISAEPGLQGNLFVGSGQSIIIDGGGSIGGTGFTGNLTGTASNADALTSAVTLNLSGNATGSTSFINAGDSVTLPVNLISSGVSAGTYGTSNDVAQITVDAQGRITTASDVAINHDALLNFVADEHIAHSSVNLTAGSGLTGGGDITTSRSFNVVGGTGITVNANDIQTDDSYIKGLLSASNGVDYNSSTGAFQAVESEIQHDSLDGFVANEHINHSGVTLTAGTGLTGGGDITTSRSFNVVGGDGITANANDIEVDSTVVRTSGNQSIAGTKTFTGTVDLSGATVPGFTVTGELSVTGNVNSLNYVDLQVQNSEIILNSNVATAQDAVIKNERGSTGNDTYLKWDEGTSRWQFSNNGSTDKDMLLMSDFSGGTGIAFNNGAISTTDADIVHDNLSGFVANEHIDHTTVSVTAGTGLTGGGTIASTRTLNVIGGDGITANANDIEVDSSVIRTTGNQSLAGDKTFTGKLILPTTDVTTENAIFTDINEAWVYVNGSKKQITPTSSLGTAEQANSSLTYSLAGSTTGTSTYELYAGKRTVGVDDFHAVKGLEEGTYTSLSETATAVTIEADINAIKGAFSVTDAGGDGSLAYNSGTGVITYTGPSAGETRAHISATGLIGFSAGGVISTTADNYSHWSLDTDTGSPQTVSSTNTVNILGGTGIDVTHSGRTITVTNTNSADITAVGAGAGLTGGGSSGGVTLNVGEGTGISVAADTISVDMSAFDTGDLTEGSNLYYTDARARAAISETSTQLSYNSTTGVLTYTQGNTDTVSEGSSNLYYTVARANSAIDARLPNTDSLSEGSSNLYHTTTRVRSALSGSSGVNYNSSTGAITADSAEIRGLFSASGDLSYDSASGQFSFTNDAGDIESVSITAGTGLTGTASATSGAFSTTLNVTGLTVSELAPTSLLTSSETFADSDTQLMTAKAIDDRIISKGYSTTTGTVTSVTGGSGLTGSITSSGSLAVGAGNYILVGANDVGVDATSTNTANKVVARDGSGNFAAGTITATATQAQYADLAENYVADESYEPGTVLIIGGEKEVTVTDVAGSYKVVGVVSTNPAYLMNSEADGVAIALRGRVPCKVTGNVNKGDVLVASNTPGYAMVGASAHTLSPLQIVGRALETKTDAQPGIIEIIV